MRLLLTLLLAASFAPAQKRPVTHEDVFKMARTGSAAPSPDGKWVVYSLTAPDYDPAKTVSDLWIVPVDGSAAPRQLTNTAGAESGYTWSPDSGSLLFVAKREGDAVAQLYLLPVGGGEARRLLPTAFAPSNPQWRPDGKAILFEAAVESGRKNPGRSTARIYEAMPVRYWNTWLDGSRPGLYVWEIGGAAPKELLEKTKLAASPGFSGLRSGLSASSSLQPAWTPSGDAIIFTAADGTASMMRAEVEYHLYRVPSGGGEPARLTPNGASYTDPAYSANGTLFALESMSPSGGRLYSLSRLIRLDGAKPVRLSPDFDRSVGSFDIAPDGAAITFSAEDNGFGKLFEVSARGGAPRVLFEPDHGGYASPRYAGKARIATFSASTLPAEVVRLEAKGHTLLTNANAALLSALDMPAPLHFWFTAKNGKRIHSVLFPPPALDSSRKYPLLVFPHGGPNAMSGDSFSTRWNSHLLTSPGYALLMTNYTGSTGFGEKFADEIERDVLRGPAREILEAVDAAAAKYPWIDTGRQCAVGASYGGYLMNWFNGHTRQFRCMVNHAGAVNNESQYGANDGGLGREQRMGAKVFETGKGQWMDQSPFRYAAEWRTPTLITQGELDYRVPIGESLMTFKLLERQGVPARLMVFPDEGHWILKGENNRHHMQEVLAWLARYLQ